MLNPAIRFQTAAAGRLNSCEVSTFTSFDKTRVDSVVAPLVDYACKFFGFFLTCTFYVEGTVPVELAGILACSFEFHPGLVVTERHRAVDQLDDFVAESHGVVIVVDQTLDNGTPTRIFRNREIANGTAMA